MRVLLVAALVGASLSLWVAAPAEAARKKAGAAKQPLNIAVLPFIGKGSGGVGAKEAIELELELVKGVRVEDSAAVEEALEEKGRKLWTSGGLGSVLDKGNIDVLIRGERGEGKKSADALLVTAWGRDGKPRFLKELPIGKTPDATALSVVAALKPVLADWRSIRPIQLGAAPSEDNRGLRPEDVLTGEDASSSGRGGKKGGGGRNGKGRDPESGSSRGSVGSSTIGRQGRVAETLGDEESAASEQAARRSRLDDDDAPREDAALVPRLTMDDVDDTAGQRADAAPSGRSLAVAAVFDGGFWLYNFTGNEGGNQQRTAILYPGGGLRLDATPLAFAGVRWLAIDGDITLSTPRFKLPTDAYPVEGELVRFSPKTFSSLQIRAGATLKLRYAFKNGAAVGARIGYRTLSAAVEPQTITLAGAQRNVTLVPGFTFHGLATGAELYWPTQLFGRPFELDLRVDGLPATFYEEAPDNPGEESLAFGWAASLALRAVVVSGLFVEVGGHSSGILASFSPAEGERTTRLAFIDNGLVAVRGGDVLNHIGGFSLGLGWMF